MPGDYSFPVFISSKDIWVLRDYLKESVRVLLV